MYDDGSPLTPNILRPFSPNEKKKKKSLSFPFHTTPINHLPPRGQLHRKGTTQPTTTKTKKKIKIFDLWSWTLLPTPLMGPTPDHLLVLVERLLPLQPHLLVELLDERLDSAVQLVLTQRRLLPQLPRPGGRTQRRVGVPVGEGLRLLHHRRRRGWLVILRLNPHSSPPHLRLPRVGLLEVPRQRHRTALRYRLPRVLQRVLPLRLRYSQCLTSSCTNKQKLTSKPSLIYAFCHHRRGDNYRVQLRPPRVRWWHLWEQNDLKNITKLRFWHHHCEKNRVEQWLPNVRYSWGEKKKTEKKKMTSKPLCDLARSTFSASKWSNFETATEIWTMGKERIVWKSDRRKYNGLVSEPLSKREMRKIDLKKPHLITLLPSSFSI